MSVRRANLLLLVFGQISETIALGSLLREWRGLRARVLDVTLTSDVSGIVHSFS